jgi:uncharacterized protein (TIGR02271 family)
LAEVQRDPRQGTVSAEAAAAMTTRLSPPVPAPQAPAAAPVPASAELVIPVVAEELRVERVVTERGHVRVHKRVHERTETVQPGPVAHDDVTVERVPVGRFVTEAPAVRVEGDTTIVPVVEEVLVVEKRLRLREEVRITRRTRAVPSPEQHVTLRTEDVEIERIPARPGDPELP